MKKAFYFMLLAMLILGACSKEELSGFFDLGLENVFKIDGIYESSDQSLKFTIVDVNDSRCPSDVVCVWAGKADVTIRMEKPVEGELLLSTLDNGISHSTDTLGNFAFSLISIEPYPVSTKTIKPEDYTIRLKVEKIN